MTEPHRLTIVIHSLDGGGAERTAARMANHWADADWPVTLITFDSGKSDRYALSSNVERRALDIMSHSRNPLAALRNNLRRIRKLRQAITKSRPERIISLTDKTNVLALAAAGRLDAPVIVAERIDPRHHYIGRIWTYLRKSLYPSAAAIVVQTAGAGQAIRFFVPKVPIYVIPNVVEAPQASSASPLPATTERKRILAVGRLVYQKGFDLLLEAFAVACKNHDQWDLTILGEGPERAFLEEMADDLEIADRVSMPGWSDEPAAVMNESDLFVLSSRYEGFPNALLEAMAAGMSVVSFDCQSGPSEIIRDGHDGLLVRAGSIEWLAAAIERLMRDQTERRRLADRAPEVVERFSAEKYYRRWEALLDGADVADPVFSTGDG